MNCPLCESNNIKNIDTRQISEVTARYKKCLYCGYKFYTLESFVNLSDIETDWKKANRGFNHAKKEKITT